MKNFLILIFVASLFSFAQADESSFEKSVVLVKPQVIVWRRYLHQNPELSNREYKTAAFVAKKLKSFGIETHIGIGKTGVVGILRGSKPGPVIGLRADLDALPIKEMVNIPFASKVTAEYLGKNVPVMHACGHDSHVAILLGTAKVLSESRKELAGTVVFVFQPAEEGAPQGEEGGAPLMIKEGVLNNPKIQVMFGLHISANLENDKIAYNIGPAQAASDRFYIKIIGKQTHGAAPWEGVDPIVVGAQVINNLQTIVSRQENLTKSPVVISISKIQAGIRENIVPEELTMSGTIRTLDYTVQKDVHARIKQITTQIASAYGAAAEVIIKPQNLINYNDPVLTKEMLPSLQKVAGIQNVGETSWSTSAEDFSFFSAKIPTIFFRLGGMKKGEKTPPSHHTSNFYIDDSNLDLGVRAFSQLVFDYAVLHQI